MDYQNKKEQEKQIVGNSSLISVINAYAFPLISLIVSVGIIFFQLVPSINRYLDLSKSNENESKKNSSLKSSLEKTEVFYDENATNINLGLELLNKIAPIDSGRISLGQQDTDNIVSKNNLSLRSFKFSENLRDVVNDSLADQIQTEFSKLRVAVSETVLTGSYNGILGFMYDIYKSGKLYVIETSSIRNNSTTENPDLWTARLVVSRYWYAEDFMANKSKVDLIQKASNEIPILLLQRIKAKI